MTTWLLQMKEKLKLKVILFLIFELWKNKSNRAIALALQEYFIKGTKPEDFINNHKNIFDYCIMASRASGQLYLEMQKVNNGEYILNHLKTCQILFI